MTIFHGVKKFFSVSLMALSILIFVPSCRKNGAQSSGAAKEIHPRTGVYYSLFVRSFADSDGDGVGDFNGIAKKLDYLEKLGISGIWLLPIYPSPSYHGYDVDDYYGVNPQYGTMEDFENLVSECKKHGIAVML
ncbi:MAG: alpha-amylase, partial [Treponema sp.]|nr:alpha-amylase [Treponema sp.]